MPLQTLLFVLMILLLLWLLCSIFLGFFVCLFVCLFVLFFKLYNIVLVLPNIEMNPPQVYLFPILNPPPSSLPIPSLWLVPVHQPQASRIVHRTWTGDLFHTWYYTCFNAILPNLPTLSRSELFKNSILLVWGPPPKAMLYPIPFYFTLCLLKTVIVII